MFEPPAASDLWERLTPAERTIVDLVGRGWSNAQIAKLRGGSTQTVANQLTPAYRKLGIASRRELAALLGAPPLPLEGYAFTTRERQILNLASRGQSNKAIAYSLGLAVSTVSAFLTRARRKLRAPAAQRVERAAFVEAAVAHGCGGGGE